MEAKIIKKVAKLLIALFILITIFIIYKINSKPHINYIALGDSLALGQNPYGQINYGYSDYIRDYLEKNKFLNFYTKKFAMSNYLISDLYDDLINNVYIKTNTNDTNLRFQLRESDLVTISIGINDILNELNLSNDTIVDSENAIYKLDSIINRIDKLLKEITKYAKGNIIFIGYYNPYSYLNNYYEKELDDIFAYLSKQINTISKKYDVFYIDIYFDFKNNNNYLPNPFDIHPNNKGYEYIARKIISIIEKEIIN